MRRGAEFDACRHTALVRLQVEFWRSLRFGPAKHWPRVKRDDAAPLARLTSLQTLEVGGAFEWIGFLSPLTRLEHLALNVGDGTGIAPLAALAPTLRSLKLAQNAPDPAALCSVLRRLSRLQALDLTEVLQLACYPDKDEMLPANLIQVRPAAWDRRAIAAAAEARLAPPVEPRPPQLRLGCGEQLSGELLVWVLEEMLPAATVELVRTCIVDEDDDEDDEDEDEEKDDGEDGDEEEDEEEENDDVDSLDSWDRAYGPSAPRPLWARPRRP
eukprot:tig00020563_g11318.t1